MKGLRSSDTRLRVGIAGEYPGNHGPTGAEAFIRRPAEYYPRQAARIEFSRQGVQPMRTLTVAEIPANSRYRGISRRFYMMGPAAAGFFFGHPPVGNLGRNFRQSPPRRLSKLLPYSRPTWDLGQPQYYGPRPMGG